MMSEEPDSRPALAQALFPAPVSTTTSPGWRNPWLLVVVRALGLAGWQWVETRIKLADTQQELARRLAESDSVSVESRALARHAQEQLAAVLGRLGALEARIAESRSQQAMLEDLYQDLAQPGRVGVGRGRAGGSAGRAAVAAGWQRASCGACPAGRRRSPSEQ